ncbi:MAG: prephenate dehydratase [Ignisphaera sp.]|nr:prephenate dehydratase [Ignisphaera sp.]MCX8168434.1 prephenate dehydratase [Ignisphaera sp.]
MKLSAYEPLSKDKAINSARDTNKIFNKNRNTSVWEGALGNNQCNNTLLSSIKDVDMEILRLLKKRIELLKKADQGTVNDTSIDSREDVITAAKELGIDEHYANFLFNYIHGISLAAIKPLRVAFLGPRASFTEEAALKIFSDSGAALIPLPSIREVFRSVENSDAEYGVVALENSLEGSVGETIDLLANSNVKICGETEIRVRHNLIVRPGTNLSDVKLVISHPHAIAQCRNFIESRLKNVRIETRPSTSDAVREAVENIGVAAIGSELAAYVYGGEIVARGIEDHKDNYTRFIAIGKSALGRGVGVKTAVIYTLPHKPGALYRALEPFAVRGLNLTKIESRPIKGKPWEYLFFMEFEGHEESDTVSEALEELKKRTTQLKILGSYRKIP